MSSLNGKTGSLIGKPIVFDIDVLSEIEEHYGSLDDFMVSSARKPVAMLKYVLGLMWKEDEEAVKSKLNDLLAKGESVESIMETMRLGFRLALGIKEDGPLQKIGKVLEAVDELASDPQLKLLMTPENEADIAKLQEQLQPLIEQLQGVTGPKALSTPSTS